MGVQGLQQRWVGDVHQGREGVGDLLLQRRKRRRRVMAWWRLGQPGSAVVHQRLQQLLSDVGHLDSMTAACDQTRRRPRSEVRSG